MLELNLKKKEGMKENAKGVAGIVKTEDDAGKIRRRGRWNGTRKDTSTSLIEFELSLCSSRKLYSAFVCWRLPSLGRLSVEERMKKPREVFF